MTNEQEEAIEKLRYVNRWYDCNNYYSRYELDCIDTVLSLIKENQTEIEKYKSLYDRALSDLVKAEKQIDLIIDEFYKKAKISTRCYLQKSVEKCMKYKNCKDCIKQYFETKVKNVESKR